MSDHMNDHIGDELLKLAELHQRGIINDHEFAWQRHYLLNPEPAPLGFWAKHRSTIITTLVILAVVVVLVGGVTRAFIKSERDAKCEVDQISVDAGLRAADPDCQ